MSTLPNNTRQVYTQYNSHCTASSSGSPRARNKTHDNSSCAEEWDEANATTHILHTMTPIVYRVTTDVCTVIIIHKFNYNSYSQLYEQILQLRFCTFHDCVYRACDLSTTGASGIAPTHPKYLTLYQHRYNYMHFTHSFIMVLYMPHCHPTHTFFMHGWENNSSGHTGVDVNDPYNKKNLGMTISMYIAHFNNTSCGE